METKNHRKGAFGENMNIKSLELQNLNFNGFNLNFGIV